MSRLPSAGDLFGRVAGYVEAHPGRVVDDPDLWQAAVALVLAGDPPSVLLIERAKREGDPWSGQMALPGGRTDPADADLSATAMRETAEEVAVSLEPARLLGALDDVAPRTPLLPPLMVRPYVFLLDEVDPPSPRPCRHEVASAFWLPLTDLVRPGVYSSVTVPLRGSTRVFPAYQVGERVIWGMTERILTPLLRGIDLIP